MIDAFGANRVLWGGDLQLVNRGVGLCNLIDLTRALLAGLSAAERAPVSQGNARRIYRLV